MFFHNAPIEHKTNNYNPKIYSESKGDLWNPYDLSGETRLTMAAGATILGPLASLAHFPDAISIELNGSAGAVVSTNTSPIGGLFKVNPNIKGPNSQAFFQGSVGLGKVGASVNAIITEYYIVGSNADAVSMENFNEYFGSFDAGVDIGISIGAGVSYSHPFEEAHIIGISYSIGVGVGASLNLTGGYMDYYSKYK